MLRCSDQALHITTFWKCCMTTAGCTVSGEERLLPIFRSPFNTCWHKPPVQPHVGSVWSSSSSADEENSEQVSAKWSTSTLLYTYFFLVTVSVNKPQELIKRHVHKTAHSVVLTWLTSEECLMFPALPKPPHTSWIRWYLVVVTDQETSLPHNMKQTLSPGWNELWAFS